MIRYLLLTFSLFAILFSSAQAPVLDLKKEELKKAPERFYYQGDDLSLRQNRAVIFSDDFSNPSNWTMTNSSSPVYDWEIVNSLSANLISLGYDSLLNSTSGGNLALVDSYSQGNFAEQNCNITTSTSIDCSTYPGVRLRFMNYHNKFYETHSVLVSNDGVNFDNYEVNTNYGIVGSNFIVSPNCEELSVIISPTAANQAAVWLRFNFNGKFNFFWAIDDIILDDQPHYDLKGVTFGYCDVAHEPYLGQRIEHTIFPPSQVRPIKVLLDMENEGVLTATDTKMKTEIYNSSSALVFNDSTPGSSLGYNLRSDSVVWNGMLAFYENYSINVLADYDSLNYDNTPLNNFKTLNLSVNAIWMDDIFARDNNIFSVNGIWTGSGNGYIIGAEFVASADHDICGINVAFAQGTDPGVIACAILYEYDSAAMGFLPVADACLDGLEFTMSSGNISQTAIVWNYLYFAAHYTLQEGKAYIAAVNHYPGAEDAIIMNGGFAIKGAITNWIYDTGSATWYYLLDIPMIRLVNGICPDGIEENNSFMTISAYPNPASEKIYVDFSLSISEKVNCSITDPSGKTILQKNYGTFATGENTITIDVSGLNSGIYFCNLKTSNGNSVQKFVVQH